MKPKYFLVKVMPSENGEMAMTESEIRFQIEYWLGIEKEGAVEVKNFRRIWAREDAMEKLGEALEAA